MPPILFLGQGHMTVQAHDNDSGKFSLSERIKSFYDHLTIKFLENWAFSSISVSYGVYQAILKAAS